MKATRLYTLFALLLMAGEVTMQAQTQSYFSPMKTPISDSLREGHALRWATMIAKTTSSLSRHSTFRMIGSLMNKNTTLQQEFSNCRPKWSCLTR